MSNSQTVDQWYSNFDNLLAFHNMGPRVLLVEDDPTSEDLVKMICEKIDDRIKVRCVKTAEQAENILSTDSLYDLIIADHFLDGKETGLDLWNACQREYN